MNVPVKESPSSLPIRRSRRRWKRFLVWILSASITVGGAIALMLPSVLPPVLQEQLTHYVRGAGFPDAVVTVSKAGWARADISVVLDPGRQQTFPRVHVRYSPFSLMDLKILEASVSDVTLTLAVDAKGNVFVVGQNMVEQGPPAPVFIPVLPFERMTLENFKITFQSPMGDMAMNGAVTVHQASDTQWDVKGAARVQNPVGQAAVEIEGTVTANGPLAMSFALSEGTLSLPQVRIEDLRANGRVFFEPGRGMTVSAQADISHILPTAIPVAAHTLQAHIDYTTGQDPPMKASLIVEKLEHTAVPAFVTPARLEVQISGNPAHRMEFTTTADVALGSMLVKASGFHDITEEKGQAKIALDPATLTEFASLPALSPWLAGHIDSVTGTFEAGADIVWRKGTWNGSSNVHLKDVTLVKEDIAVMGVNTALKITSLNPLALPEGQVIKAASVMAGGSFTEAQLMFGLSSKNVMSIQKVQSLWSGGSIAIKPFKFSVAAPVLSTAIELKKIQLDQLLALVNVEGLAATGTVTGTVPLRLEGDTIHLENGVLKAEGPGTLRYDPSDPPSYLQAGEGEESGGTNILMQALTDFRYETLEATVDGTVGQELSIGLKIRGANPSFYNGYPVSLNLGLTGALDTIVRRSLKTYEIPDAVQKQLIEQQAQ